MKILVVDRDLSVCRLYQEELTEDGHQVFFADFADRVLKAIVKRQPEVLILGSRLPDIVAVDYCSHDLLVQLRAKFPELKVIYNSSVPEFRTKAWQLGADYCVNKGSDLTELRNIVQEIGQLKQIQSIM